MRFKFLIAVLLAVCFSFQSHAKGLTGTNAVIYAAAAQGNVAELKKYLAANPNLTKLRDSLLRTAALHGRKDAVEFLISKGASVNGKGFFQTSLLTALAWSAGPDGFHDPEYDRKCAEIASILIAHGATVDPVDNYGKTPLMWAVECEKSRLAEVLLEHGADPRRRYHGARSGMTPFHMAVENGDTNMVAVLLKFKAPLNAHDRNGATPLLLAEELNKTEIAAMIRKADPVAAKRYSIPPTKEAMQALAKRIAAGDDKAFNELASTALKLYGQIKDYRKEHARVMVLLFRMSAAFDVLGEEAGRGNKKAFQALKKSLRRPYLRSFAPDALGIAAAAGNKQALNILLHYHNWNILNSTAIFALVRPTKADVAPAVDFMVAWLGNLKPDDRDGGMVMSTTNALASAADKGNEEAKEALEKFESVSATPGN